MFTVVLRCAWVVFGAIPVVYGSDLDRELVLARHAGSAAGDDAIVRAQEAAASPRATRAHFVRLARAYVTKARRTLDDGYYKLAEKTIEVAEAGFGGDADVELLRGHVQHNLHRFAAAEATGRGLVAARGAAADFALLSDALVEQGKLAEAIPVLQRLVDVNPGAEALARVSHLRWLKGDLGGALDAIEVAARAADARSPETRAWMLVRLSGLYLQRGDAGRAWHLAVEASAAVREFPPALFAEGRALWAAGERAAAVERLGRAAELNPVPEYQWWLADVLRETGDADAALRVEAQLTARGVAADPRTIALFLATRGENPAWALRLARQELGRRADVFSHDALGWALAAAGDLEGARTAMRAALAENTADARLALHAGEIARRQGRAGEAAEHFARARAFAATLTPSERARLFSQDNHP